MFVIFFLNSEFQFSLKEPNKVAMVTQDAEPPATVLWET